jgi:DNA-binding XRE family transcriptional regulator
VPKPSLATLGSDVSRFRGKSKTLREAAKEIGTSAATLMRVESGRVPDVETFGKLCKWMKVDPASYLGIAGVAGSPSTESLPMNSIGNSAMTPVSPPLVVSAHLRADRQPKPETAQALAKMIMHAVSRQRPTDPVDGT